MTDDCVLRADGVWSWSAVEIDTYVNCKMYKDSQDMDENKRSLEGMRHEVRKLQADLGTLSTQLSTQFGNSSGAITDLRAELRDTQQRDAEQFARLQDTVDTATTKANVAAKQANEAKSLSCDETCQENIAELLSKNAGFKGSLRVDVSDALKEDDYFVGIVSQSICGKDDCSSIVDKLKDTVHTQVGALAQGMFKQKLDNLHGIMTSLSSKVETEKLATGDRLKAMEDQVSSAKTDVRVMKPQIEEFGNQLDRFDALVVATGVGSLRSEINAVRVSLEGEHAAMREEFDGKMGLMDTSVNVKVGALQTSLTSELAALQEQLSAVVVSDTSLSSQVTALQEQLAASKVLAKGRCDGDHGSAANQACDAEFPKCIDYVPHTRMGYCAHRGLSSELTQLQTQLGGSRTWAEGRFTAHDDLINALLGRFPSSTEVKFGNTVIKENDVKTLQNTAFTGLMGVADKLTGFADMTRPINIWTGRNDHANCAYLSKDKNEFKFLHGETGCTHAKREPHHRFYMQIMDRNAMTQKEKDVRGNMVSWYS
jgi:hypothetical protein